MIRRNEIMTTLRMMQEEHLDVRTVTMGINLNDCRRDDISATAQAIQDKITGRCGKLVSVCDDLNTEYGLQIVNKRLAVSPVSILLEGRKPEDALIIAKAMDSAAESVGIDLIGGFSALVHKGMTPAEKMLIESLPTVLSSTQRVCASVNVGTTKAGLNVDAVNLVSKAVFDIAEATKDNHGFGAAKLVVFANIPEDSPFMAGAYLGAGEPECVVNVGVSGPGVVKRAVDRLKEENPACTLNDIAEEVKHTAFRVTRAGELIGREAARRLNETFGVVDLSLAPTPVVGDSIGEIYQSMGIDRIGAPGTTAAVAMLNDAVKKGGAFASSSVGGLSGAFIPVMEDHTLSAAVARGDLTLEKLEAMTAVCSVGLDMILIPGNVNHAVLSGIIMDEASIGIINRKTTAVRIIPVPGGKVGDHIDFGGLFGSGTIMKINCPEGSETFVNRGGRIPAPLQSLSN